VKSEAKQASAVIFRARDVLVGQRTQLINAICGHLSEYGLIAPQGPFHVERLIAQIEDPTSDLPQTARTCLAVLLGALRHLQDQTAALDAEIAARAKADDVARRLMTLPGIGPLIATAIEALVPPVETFRSGRDFAVWVGPRLCSARPEARNASAGPRAWASARCGDFSSSPQALSYAGPNARACRQAHGSAGAGPQTADAGDRRPDQQECAHRLGAADERRDLPSSGRPRVDGAKRLRFLEDENGRLKRMFTDAMLDNPALKDLLGKEW